MRKKKSSPVPANVSLGKTESFKPTTIDQLLGDIGQSNYRYLRDQFSETEYTDYLRSMLPSDLYRHAQEHDYAYNDNRELLIRKLVDKFRLNRAQYKPNVGAQSVSPDIKKLSPELQNFLAGAR